MIKFVEIFIDTIVIWMAAYGAGNAVLIDENKKISFNKIVVIIFFSIVLAILNLLNSEILHGIIKILTVYLLQCMFFKLIFKQSISKTVIFSLIWYLFLCLSEIFVVLTSSYILDLLGYSIRSMKNNLILNCFISVINFIMIYSFKYKLRSILDNNHIDKKGNIIIFFSILIIISLLLYRIPLNKWKMDVDFFVTMFTLFSFCIIGIYMLKQSSDIEKTTSMYQHVVEYSDTTNKVLEDYRMIGHEHKNQLSIIRQMVHKDNVELIEYLDSLLAKRNGIKYKWVSELNKLPLEGLKGLINYKLIEAEENKINISVIISKDVSKVKLNKLSTSEKDHLYSIGGVYLDNAIQAASKSKTKEINIEIYKENKELIFIIGNTFSGKVELEKLDDYGYSTKGKNHGVGLHLVKTIIDEDRLFSQSRKIVDKYYIQELRINISTINKKKK